MLLFALKNGFRITAVEPQPDPEENRIWLEKELQAAEPMAQASSSALP
jgi:hypothetical protein